MYNFKNHLVGEEEILYSGGAMKKAGNKQVFLILSLEAVLLFLFIYFVKNFSKMSLKNGMVGTSIMIAVIGLFICLLAYAFVYNCFIKDKKTEAASYCLTNKRVMKYDGNTQKFCCGSLINYKSIYTSNISQDGSFGDVHFEMALDENIQHDPKLALQYMKNTIQNTNTNETPVIVFESIANPIEVCHLAKENLDKQYQ